MRIPGVRSSYKASGAIKIPAGIDQEQGSSASIIIPEIVPELASRQVAIRTYDKMARTDAVCGVALRAAKAPILGADFYFEPASDDPEAADQAEFVEYNIMNALSTPFIQVLSKINKNWQHGTAVVEVVYQMDEWKPSRKGSNAKQYTMLRKLAYRPTLTLGQILVDANGGPISISQNAMDGQGKSREVIIPIEKAIIFPFGDGDSYWGDSIMRAAYPHWYYKNYLYKIDAIQKERHGIGVPVGRYPTGATQKSKDLLKSLVENIRTNERASAVIPMEYEIGFAKLEGALVDVLKSASQHDMLILLNTMAEFMVLGLESSGSGGGRATGAAQLDIFYKSLWFTANSICESFNNYLIPNLIQYNFNTDQFPKMKVRNIGQTRDLQQFAAAFSNLVHEEIITPDLPLEQWVRNIIDAPRKTEPRPEFSPTQVRKIINESTINKNGGTTPPVTPPVSGGSAPSGVKKGQGNSDKGTNVQ